MQIYFDAEIGGPETRCRMVNWQVVGVPEWCCEKVMDEWDVLLGLAVSGFPRPENLWCCLYVTHFTTAEDMVRAIVPITYCPWCGEWIDIRMASGKHAGKPLR